MVQNIVRRDITHKDIARHIQTALDINICVRLVQPILGKTPYLCYVNGKMTVKWRKITTKSGASGRAYNFVGTRNEQESYSPIKKFNLDGSNGC